MLCIFEHQVSHFQIFALEESHSLCIKNFHEKVRVRNCISLYNFIKLHSIKNTVLPLVLVGRCMAVNKNKERKEINVSVHYYNNKSSIMKIIGRETRETRETSSVTHKVSGCFAGVLPPLFSFAIECATTTNSEIWNTVKHNPMLSILVCRHLSPCLDCAIELTCWIQTIEKSVYNRSEIKLIFNI